MLIGLFYFWSLLSIDLTYLPKPKSAKKVKKYYAHYSKKLIYLLKHYPNQYPKPEVAYPRPEKKIRVLPDPTRYPRKFYPSIPYYILYTHFPTRKTTIRQSGIDESFGSSARSKGFGNLSNRNLVVHC